MARGTPLRCRATPVGLLAISAAASSMARQVGIALGQAVASTAWALSGHTPAGMRVAAGLGRAAAPLAVPALTHGAETGRDRPE